MEPIRYNNFQVRLAGSPEDIDAAQALRYRVFYEEMAATPTRRNAGEAPRLRCVRRDLRSSAGDRPGPGNGAKASSVPTGCCGAPWRLLHGGFYSAQEYDLSALLRYPGEIVELGRSCVDSGYRGGARHADAMARLGPVRARARYAC